ncbi:MAG: LysM peptidoglycan-binding domain-containing protein [Caldilineaceae bacterium]|nr:LysM peptidoglycan-binding domain-containing protein [Caldilineaceae bacterium]
MSVVEESDLLPVLSQANVPITTEQEPAAPLIHTVQAGETLSQIATRYGVTVDAIVAANQLANPNLLHIGQRLEIPGPGAPTPARAAAERRPVPTSEQADASIHYACPANAAAYPLSLPADPIRLVVVEGYLYFVADGDLYYLPIADLVAQENIAPVNLMPTQRAVGANYFIQELVYLSVDAATGELLLLDKTNDIYRYSAVRGWQMAYPAAPVPGQYPDPQFLAVQTVDNRVYALDSDLSRIWIFTPGAKLPRAYLIEGRLSSGVDFVLAQNSSGGMSAFVFTREGYLFGIENGWQVRRLEPFSSAAAIDWPSQIFQAGDHLAAVSGDQRSVIGIDPRTGGVAWRIVFRFSAMPRLRSTAILDDTLYGLAGRNLYVAKLSDTSTDCPPVVYDDTFTFHGIGLEGLLPYAQLPFTSATLPMRPRSYPGARRLYRYGIHKGLDLYSTEVAGLSVGSRVRAIADGIVTRIDSDYREFTPAQYEEAIARAEAEHRTPPDVADHLLGRQVRIDHGEDVESWYAHLSAVPTEVGVGDAIAQGDVVGRVGVSGTSAGANGTQAGVHLHFEIWIGDRYLGQGLTLYETMRLWQALFAGPQRSGDRAPVLATPTATPAPLLGVTPAPPATSDLPDDQPCQRPPDDYTRVAIGEHTVNARTLWMLQLASHLYTGRGDPLRVTQGSYTSSLDASFGTHSGGGVVDISIRTRANPADILTVAEASELVRALRQAGFAAWLRLPTDLNPPPPLHIHAVAVGDRELSPAARLQLDGPEGYFRGLDGVPSEHGGPKADREGGPIMCDWMVEAGFDDLR